MRGKLAFALVFVCPPGLKRHVLRMLCGAKIGKGARIGWFSTVSGSRIVLGDHAEVRACTIIRCDGEVTIGAYSAISNFNLIYGAGSLIIGERCYIGPQCLINADEEVRIGDESAFSPRCMLFTHGSFYPYTEGYWVKHAPVTIGSRVWVAAGVSIRPGVEIGDEVFVNSGSVVTADIPSGQVVEGFPARQVATVDKLKRKMTPRRVDAAAREMLRHFSEAVLQRGMGIEVANGDGRYAFRCDGRDYVVTCVPSDGAGGELDADNRAVLLVNRSDWVAPPELKEPLVFDLTTKRTRRVRDRVHRELRTFMLRYYGVCFEYE